MLTMARIMQVSWRGEQYGERIGKAEPTSGLGSGTVILVTRNVNAMTVMMVARLGAQPHCERDR